MMLKTLFIFQRIVKFLALSMLCSGCAIEQTYTYDLYITNKTPEVIRYCESYEEEICPHKIEPGSSERIVYLTHTMQEDMSERYIAFDRTQIKMCGRTIAFASIRSVSPVARRSTRSYEVIIDERVYYKLCKS